MKILNGLYLIDSNNGSYIVKDKDRELFKGNYNECIYMINHMGKRNNCNIPYTITSEQIEAFKDLDREVQEKFEQIIINEHHSIVEYYNQYWL